MIFWCVGLDNFPDLVGSVDTNEEGDPTVPHLRSLDAFFLQDEAIPLILSGGITTFLSLPGSANLMGGEVRQQIQQ
jgi:hypothetical protein